MGSDGQNFVSKVVDVVDNFSREISGQNGGFFDPFNAGRVVEGWMGSTNGIFTQASDAWRKTKTEINNSAESNVRNVAGEISGSNKSRQKQWEDKVKADAQAAQDKLFADQLDAKRIADLAGSRGAAAGNRSPGSRLGRSLNWAENGADVTDFLGL